MGLFEDLVKKKLEEYVPQVECYDRDKKLFEICVSDLKYYLVYKWNFESHLLEQDFREKFLECINEEGENILPIVDLWIKNWIMQWDKRVKIVIRDEDYTLDKRQLSNFVRKGEASLSPLEIEELKYPVVCTLIEHGEIVGLDIISEQVIKGELGKVYSTPSTWDVKEKLNFINMVMKKVGEYTSITGPLIFIKLTGIYFRNL